MKILVACILVVISIKTLYSQSYDDIYRTLLNDINQEVSNPDQWIITKTEIIRYTFRQLNKYNLPKFTALGAISSGYDTSFARRYEKVILNGNAYVIIALGDEQEIRSMQFKSYERLPFTTEEITDWNQLQYVLSKKNYDRLKEKSDDIESISFTKDRTKELHEYIVNFNMLNPTAQFFSYQSDEIYSPYNHGTVGNLYEYVVSFAGQWGENLTVNPGWFSSDYILGLSLSSYNKLNRSRTYYRPNLSLMVGAAIERNFTAKSNLPAKSLRSSGEGIYLRLTGKVCDSMSDSTSLKNLEIILSAKFNFSIYGWQDYGNPGFVDVFTNRNYLTLQINNKEEDIKIMRFGELQYGIGFVFYDIHHLQLDPKNRSVSDIESGKPPIKRYKTSIFGEIGVENISNICEHDFKIFLNYEPQNKYGYIGFLLSFLITDTFGFDLRYYRTITGRNNLPPWRTDEYFVFSPIIKIVN